MKTHFYKNIIKMSVRYGDWGKKSLCGKNFRRGDDSNKVTSASKRIDCQECLYELVGIKEKELDAIRWTLQYIQKRGESS